MEGKTAIERLRKTRAMSPAVSMVIITASTIVMVLIASIYAYQVLERQRGASEFDAVKKSFIAFDDAVHDVALDKRGSRSARFTVSYGVLKLVPNALFLSINVDDYPNVNYNDTVGYVRYEIPTDYVNLGSGYKEYILGDNKTVVTSITEDLCCALIEQESESVHLTLYYRVRIMGPTTVQVNGSTVNYVEILVVKLTAARFSAFKEADFDLTAKNVGITTQSLGPYAVDEDGSVTVTVTLGETTSSVDIDLNGEYVVFNLVIARVSVSV